MLLSASPAFAARLRGALLAGALMLGVAAGCSKDRDTSPFTAESGHPEDFLARHPAAFAAESGSCLRCHGSDLLGGISEVSCSSPSRDGQVCHAGGPGGGHPAGWAAAESHGAAAKAAPGSASGAAWCRGCHGAGFGGGPSLSCFGCHGVAAPHARAPWRGGERTHTNTDPGNAAACALCHRSRVGEPGCFVGTLCHAQPSGHPPGWASRNRHGAAALARSPGLGSCLACHGADFAGGAGPSCLGCHGWRAAHPRGGWVGGGRRHRETSRSNAAACARCHDDPKNRLPPACFNASLCHAEPNPHEGGWKSPLLHGTAAKAAPGAGTGFASCGRCHGSDFAGATARSCFPCHGLDAPHGRTAWIGGGRSHQTTKTENADVCGQCHDNPANNLPPGCYTAGLCHGRVRGHVAGWELPSRHGAAAKAAPGPLSGFASCLPCHGRFLSGDIGPDCSRCHGWSAPHGHTGWRAVSHTTADPRNTLVCQNCHRSRPGDPGCYNGTLCHLGVPGPAVP